jgi:hypothetical protein
MGGRNTTMTKNLGNADRILRLVAAVPLTACAFLAPLDAPIRLVAFGVPAVYMLFTTLAGTCLGYALMGRSTCPVAAAKGG